jgi:hypothetical protein
MKKAFRFTMLGIALMFVVCFTTITVLAQESDQMLAGDVAITNGRISFPKMMPHNFAATKFSSDGLSKFQEGSEGIPNIDSVPNFNGQFFTFGYDPNNNPNNHWFYNMMGNSPRRGDTTIIPAPIVPVIVDMRNFDGSPRFVNGVRLISDPTQFVVPTIDSPVFQTSQFDSSRTPTQVSDAIQRAEFHETAERDWHTLLLPSVKPAKTMTLIRGTYRFSLNADGSCCRFVLVDIGTFENAFLPPAAADNTTTVGQAELAGDITTHDMSTFLFPNTYLYFNNDPNQCCVLGFHTYDSEVGDASNGNRERRFVLNYSSWISPGLFGAGFQDVTATSHEVSETFNDPFVASDGIHNITPWWLSPNGNCQDNLEDGDVIEGLPNTTFPITMNGLTYHPQNEALLPWFEFQADSRAIHDAYSYPDTTVLTALSPVEHAGCP